MDQPNKFVINEISPVLLDIISKDECILVCLSYQTLDEKQVYTETKIRFSHPTPLEVGAKINLAGTDIKRLMKEKVKDNTIISGFQAILDAENRYYYQCRGTTYSRDVVDLFIPRHTFVRIKYMLDAIIINGGFPKSAKYMFDYHDMHFIRVEKVSLEGSKVIDKKTNALYNTNISIVKNAFKLENGPKEYTVVETIGVSKDIEDKDLLIPTPEYVFTKVYVNKDEVSRLTMDDGELLLIQFNIKSLRGDITVYSIVDVDNIHKLSSNYWIKGEE